MSKQHTSIIIIGLILLLALLGGSWGVTFGAQPNQGTIPTYTSTPEEEEEEPTATATRKPGAPVPQMTILSVKCDQEVTIRTKNFPRNIDFVVRMNTFGTRGINGEKVTTVNSGTGGVQTWTFTIPSALRGLDRIAIRLDGTGGYYSFNWFWNRSTDGSSCLVTTRTPSVKPTATGTLVKTPAAPIKIPRFSIKSVERDQSVTVVTKDFPANDHFIVLMNTFGTKGVNGVKVGEVDSGSGGSLTFTFDIPESMKGKAMIALRFESPSSGYYSFNWFWNLTKP